MQSSSSPAATSASTRLKGAEPRMERLDAIDGRVGDPALRELLQPLVGDLGLGSDFPQGEPGSAGLAEARLGVSQKVHRDQYGEFFPRLSRSTFPKALSMLAPMADTPPSDLQRLFKANIEKARLHRGISGREAAKRGDLDPKTFSNAGRAANAANLRSVEGLAKGLQFEPWQLLVPGFDPRRPPSLRKREAVAPPSDQLTEMMLELWGKLSPNERVSVLSRAQEVATEARAGAPPGPRQALQKIP